MKFENLGPLPYLESVALLSGLLAFLDSLARWLVPPLASWILLSGVDDVFLDGVCFLTWLTKKSIFRERDEQGEWTEAQAAPQKRLAIFVPCWQEDGVIAEMVENNLRRIEYRNYDFFLGVYPNDTPTMEVVSMLERMSKRVHMAVCANPGPTSKADCLNAIFQRMAQFEQENQTRFEMVLTHDAEDVIHPYALHWINYYSDSYDMVQVPVLPLATPLRDLVHGVYCDEFSEFQMKDMPGRQILGGFIPSNGVGTGFSRWALQQLADSDGRIFQPDSLTEDYENGLRLHFLGCPQLFMTIRLHEGQPVATREYFPRNRRAAIRQRTRWVTGIALQSWQRHGWRGGPGTVYWLWRDRKGLIGNPVSMLTSVLFIYGMLTWWISRLTGLPWGMSSISQTIAPLILLQATASLQLVHLAVRAWCSAQIYGWRFAALSPVRAMYGNYINFRATIGAIKRYFLAWRGSAGLVWLKTEHTYPGHTQPGPACWSLDEILVSSGTLTQDDLDRALASKPAEENIAEYLLRRGVVTEKPLYEALSLQVKIPLRRIEPGRIRLRVARSLPRTVMEQWRVVPFQVSEGHLFVASSQYLDESAATELQRHTKLRLRFHLVTPSNFQRLRKELL